MTKIRIQNLRILPLILTVLLLPVCARAAGPLDNAAVQTLLMNYNEPGYKFLEKIDVGMWKVLYARPGWDFGWEVVITATGDSPESSLLVIGTTVTTAESLNPTFLMQILDENSYDTNPGSYSVFLQDGLYFVQYAVKLPQSLISEDVLKEAIGFVAGYSNSRVKALEGILGNVKAGTPAPEDSSTKPPADEKKEPASSKPKPAAPGDTPQPPVQEPPPSEEGE